MLNMTNRIDMKFKARIGIPLKMAIYSRKRQFSLKRFLGDNRAYPMFVFLFGYGSMLLFQKMERSGFDKRKILKQFRLRVFWLLVFGFFILFWCSIMRYWHPTE